MSPLTSFRVYTLLTIVRPDLSLFALQCINLEGQRGKGPRSPRLPGSSALSDLSVSSHPSAFTFPGDGTVVSEHGPDVYERTSYYDGIAGDDHPELVYRSDYLPPSPSPSVDSPRFLSSRSTESSTPRLIVSGTLSILRFVT